MQPLLVIAAAVAALVVMHCLVVSLVGRSMGIAITHVEIGVGPRLVNSSSFQLRAFPFSSQVRFRHSADEWIPDDLAHTALDAKPFSQQLLLTLTGPLVLIAVSVATLGREGVAAFVSGFPQIVHGAISPLHEAKRLISNGMSFVQASSQIESLGLVAAKLAALNLLPLPAFNGGAAVALILRRLGLARDLGQNELKWLYFGHVAFFASWTFALIHLLTIG
jgi:membrane-associated protease RseP (regulator of RpoE activity)